MAKFYAWTNFDIERNEWGQTVNVIHVGDEVDQSKLEMSDEEWNSLVESGAVREEKYPDIPDDVSPAEYLRQKIADDEASEDEVKVYADMLVKSGTADTVARRSWEGKTQEEMEAEHPTEDPDKEGESSNKEGESSSSTTASKPTSTTAPATTPASAPKPS